VEAAELLSRGGSELHNGGMIGHIAGLRLAADLARDLLDQRTVARHQHDLGAFFGQRRATPSPSPRLAPVTNAIFPCKLIVLPPLQSTP
jgi:hypothetical protein